MLRLLTSAVAALLLSTPAKAELSPSAPEVIANAAVDCWEAASGPVLNEAQLQSRGWKAGTTTADGKPVASPMRFYGKGKSHVMLMVMETPGANGCVIVSSVAKPEDIGTTAQLLMSRLQAIDPAVKGVRQGQSIVYVSVPRVAELIPTGTLEKPATRIVVAHTSPEKK